MKKYLYPREWFFVAAQLIAAVAFVWALFNNLSRHNCNLSQIAFS
jgi:hypothetical protein